MPEMKDGMYRYEVVLLDPDTMCRWSMMFWADDFAHAQEQAEDTESANVANGASVSEIIEIKKEYK